MPENKVFNHAPQNVLPYDTFSANSLKILEKSTEEFRLKYIENLYLTPDSSQTKAGQNLHNFLCFYFKNFDTSKIEAAFNKEDKDFINGIKEFNAIKTLKSAHAKHIEQPFLIKCIPENFCCFYLTGRFDAVLTNGGEIKIYDWKTASLPKNPENDLQTVVYLYAASKLYGTENISIEYVSLTKNGSVKINYTPEFDYFKRIFDVVQKLSA